MSSNTRGLLAVVSGVAVALTLGCGNGNPTGGTTGSSGAASTGGTTGAHGTTGGSTGAGTTGGSTGGTSGGTTGAGTTGAATTGSSTGGAIYPTVSIQAPMANQIVALGGDSNKTVPVQFAVTNFTLMAPGSNSCPAGSCGHIHLLIDGTACNASGAPYDNAATASPALAQFASCPATSLTPGSAHTITLELHNNDHSPVNGANGQVISTTVSVLLPATGANPAIVLDQPQNGSVVTAGSDSHSSVPVTFSVENFSLSAPGSCPASSAGLCGHVHVLVDGAACTPSGSPYDNAAVASPAKAYLASCSAVAGTHTVTLELHNDDHSPVQVGGVTVSASTTVTVVAAGGTAPTTPSIALLAPSEGQTIALGGDSSMSVPVQFAVQNFTLMAPGSSGCPAGSCGHIHLIVDPGTGSTPSACNTGSAPYNAAGAASPMLAAFASCLATSITPGSSHVIRLELHNNDHTPVNDASGNVIAAQETVVIGPATGGTPGITLDAIGSGDSIALGTDSHKSVSVGFTVSDFDVTPPGSCPSSSAGLCGHVHVLIDGTACTPTGSPYDNAAIASPAQAYFASCSAPAGSHTITLELHNDDHSPVKVNGTTVAASVPVVTH
ncbi:MAG: hypothetical protein ACYCWW_06335 [Deltaproteobacteria bacterium]